jgi:phospholipid transport system transporter-binding protein
MKVEITWQDDRTLRISGELSFNTVSQLSQQAETIIAKNKYLIIDLSGVNRSDSAGLAMLLAWSKAAEDYQASLKFINPPEQIQRIAAISNVAEILKFNEP